jgi:hypothetical protein
MGVDSGSSSIVELSQAQLSKTEADLADHGLFALVPHARGEDGGVSACRFVRRWHS